MLLGRLNSFGRLGVLSYPLIVTLLAVGAAGTPLIGQVNGSPTSGGTGRSTETSEPIPAWVPLAHPRAVQSFIGGYHNTGAPVESRLVAMGLGDGIYFASGDWGRWRYRLGLSAAVRGLFDAGVSSFDFLAADFIVGVPFYLQHGKWMARLRLYHQSSHAGDDLLGREDGRVSAEAYDFESAEIFVGRELGHVYGYAGLESRWRRTPGGQPSVLPHTGIEYRPTRRAEGLSPAVGAHLTWTGDGRDPTLNLRGGVLWTRTQTAGPARRPTGLFIELRTGPAVAGRFLGRKRTSLGVAVQVGTRGG